MDRIQTVRRIGACENHLAQAEWTGTPIPPCVEQASYLCEFCGHLLCGSHAGGHAHDPASHPADLATRYQGEVAKLEQELKALTADACTTAAELQAALAKAALVDRIKEWVGREQ